METKWYEWVFGGVGCTILIVAYNFYFDKKRCKQNQVAGDNVKQYQEYDGDGVEQIQEAQDNAEQIQIGGKNV